MIKTTYGDLKPELLQEFSRISGNVLKGKKWIIESDNVEYYQLTNASSQDKGKRYTKKKGWLPVRDLNFQYAMHRNKNNIINAMKFAKEKLFDISGDPVYLPEEMALSNGLDPEKRPYSYSSIFKEIEDEKIRKYNDN